MPTELTLTYLTATSSLTIADNDAALLEDILADPQVFADQCIEQLRVRLAERIGNRLLQRTRPIVDAYKAATARTREDFERLAEEAIAAKEAKPDKKKS